MTMVVPVDCRLHVNLPPFALLAPIATRCFANRPKHPRAYRDFTAKRQPLTLQPADPLVIWPRRQCAVQRVTRFVVGVVYSHAQPIVYERALVPVSDNGCMYAGSTRRYAKRADLNDVCFIAPSRLAFVARDLAQQHLVLIAWDFLPLVGHPTSILHRRFVQSKAIRSRRTFRSRFYLLKLQLRPQQCRQPSSQVCSYVREHAHTGKLVQERRAAPQTTRFDLQRHQLRLQRNTVDPASDPNPPLHTPFQNINIALPSTARRDRKDANVRFISGHRE